MGTKMIRAQVAKNGQDEVMLAVLGGHLDTAVQLALAGADLTRGDQQGQTALQHAIAASNREVWSALQHLPFDTLRL